MKLNKDSTKQAITELPTFVLRDVGVKDTKEDGSINWQEQEDKAVTEQDNHIALAYVTSRYNLVQFKDIFMPIVDNIKEELEGTLYYYSGMGQLFVFPDIDELKDNEDKFGLVLVNSVNKSSSIIVKFCIKHGSKLITVPDVKGLGFKQMHTTRASSITKDYVKVLSNIKNIWKTIIATFNKKVDNDYIRIVLKDVGFDREINLMKKLTKKMELATATNNQLTLWEVFIDIIDVVNAKNYKTDFHKQKKLDKVSEKIFKQAIIMKLI